MNKKSIAVGAAFVLAVSLLYLLQFVGFGPTPVVVNSSAVSDQPVAPAREETADPIPPDVPRPDPPKITPPKSATVYRVDASGERARLVPVKVTLPAGENGMAAALGALAGVEDSPLPPGTRVRSVATMGKGVVHVDFNDAFRSNFPGGDEEEALTIGAITGTLAQFFGVERVLITVEGRKIDSLGGNQSLGEPLPVRRDDAPAKAAQGAP